MPLNRSKGNMYPWVDYTLTIYRRCDHNCICCYRKAIQGYEKWSEVAEQDFKLDLSNKGTIFVANTGDLFGDWVDPDIIHRVLQLCRKFPGNIYLFQSKNPIRFLECLNYFPMHTIFGTTIETNHAGLIAKYSSAPLPFERYLAMASLNSKHKLMVSIEPIMQFNLTMLIDWIKQIQPTFVSIGADSKDNNLIEPDFKTIEQLTSCLRRYTEVKWKRNLFRLR